MGRGMYKRKTTKPPIPMSERLGPPSLFRVRVTVPSLNVRFQPSTSAKIVAVLTNYPENDILEVKDGFGRIGDNSWIMLRYTKKIE